MARIQGVGLGLRASFVDEVIDGPDLPVAFFEITPETVIGGGRRAAALERIADRYAVVTHGVTLSLGSVEPPPETYLAALEAVLGRTKTPWHSDHLCFGRSGAVVLHELLPLKLCAESVVRVSDRLLRVQDRLGVPMAIENVSWYAHPGKATMSEVDVVSEIVERSGCGLLLDVNNVFVNAKNHGFDPRAFIAGLPLDRVVEIHVAGHARVDDLGPFRDGSTSMLIDTHGADVCTEVYDLLAWTLVRTGPRPVLLERDNHVPLLADLLREVAVLDAVCRAATGEEVARA